MNDTLQTYCSRPCDACGRPAPSDPAHIKSRGSGGKDEDSNLLSLCRVHHTMSHALGWRLFLHRYPHLVQVLEEKGWHIENTKLRRKDLLTEPTD